MTTTNVPNLTKVTIGLIVGITAASTAAIFIRLAQSNGAPSIVIAAARLTIASMILAPIALTRNKDEFCKLRRSEWILALLSGIFLALHFATWIKSLEYTSVASSVVLVTTTPLWVAILSPMVLHERIGKWTIMGMILALIGGLIIGISDTCSIEHGSILCPQFQAIFSGITFLGDFLALIGAWMAAGYLLIGRKLRTRLSLTPYVFLVYGMASILLITFMLLRNEKPFGLPPLAYLWFILLAIFPQLIGHTSFNWALKYSPASFVAVVLLGEPIGSSILALIIFKEQPSPINITGMVLIFLGIWMAAINSRT